MFLFNETRKTRRQFGQISRAWSRSGPALENALISNQITSNSLIQLNPKKPVELFWKPRTKKMWIRDKSIKLSLLLVPLSILYECVFVCICDISPKHNHFKLTILFDSIHLFVSNMLHVVHSQLCNTFSDTILYICYYLNPIAWTCFGREVIWCISRSVIEWTMDCSLGGGQWAGQLYLYWMRLLKAVESQPDHAIAKIAKIVDEDHDKDKGGECNWMKFPESNDRCNNINKEWHWFKVYWVKNSFNH